MIENIILKVIAYLGDDTKRINHALKVFGLAKAIGGGEELAEDEMKVVECAAILHDIGIKNAEKKYGSSSGKYQEIEGPPVAQELLKSVVSSPAVIERVCYLVGNHHSYGKIDKKDFQILVEADLLVNIYEDGLSREAALSMRDKYFKTDTGIKLINSMFITDND